MGRPREHDDRTAAVLLAQAERVITQSGFQALSVRGLAAATGSTTRAVYSLFGSKDGLVLALGVRAFKLLTEDLESLPVTADPAGDLVEAGVTVFRRFTVGHPALFEIGFLHAGVPPELAHRLCEGQRSALAGLHARLGRLKRGGQLGGRNTADAALEFHALCEGLAALELRGVITAPAAEQIWRDALGALVAGWGSG